MKTVLFTYETPVGTFWIRPEPADRVQLGIDRQKLKTYASARLAAKAVGDRTTGWAPWDSLEGVAAPTRLSAWKRPVSQTPLRRQQESTRGADSE